MANIFCTKCGTQMPDNATVCPSCGHIRTSVLAPPTRPSARVSGPANPLVGQETQGFFAILLDTSFSDFISLKLIGFFYILGCIVAVISALVSLVGAFNKSAGAGFVALILTPIGLILSIIGIRCILEMVAAVFRIAENTTEMAKNPNRQ